jgi:hypothetical protein
VTGRTFSFVDIGSAVGEDVSGKKQRQQDFGEGCPQHRVFQQPANPLKPAPNSQI